MRKLFQCAAMLLALHCGFAHAQPPVTPIEPELVQKLAANDGAWGDLFGCSPSLSGNIALIGAPHDDDKGIDSGSVYAFIRSEDGTWTQEAKLLASDGQGGQAYPALDDQFGSDVSVDGNIAAIGTGYKQAVYVFVRSEDGTWTQEAELSASDFSFGTRLAISGNTLLVGALQNNDKGTGAGAVYVFVRSEDGTWTQEAKLFASDGHANEWFGYSLSLDKDTAVIGAIRDENYAGSAYVFIRSSDGNWIQQAKLTASNRTAYDYFSHSISVNGDTVLIGANWDEDGEETGYNSGAAYVFVRSSDGIWKQQDRILPDDGIRSGEFGGSVSIDGDIALIGSVGGNDSISYRSGSVYVFVRASDGRWKQQAKLVAPDASAHDYFGAPVVSNGTALIGAGGDNDFGSVYVYSLPTLLDAYTVTPSAGTGGGISPDAPQTVNEGATTSFTVLADSGYRVEKVEGCDGTLSGNTYTTAPVTEDCAVTASFTPHAARNGMTWGLALYNSDLDITRVHCYGQVGPNRGPCNPYQGDTSCSTALPLLCVKVDGRPRPAYAMSACSTCAMEDEYYNGWAEGSIGLTAPAQGNAFATLADADAYCAAQLGEGYKVAEHHTGRYVIGMDENNFYGSTWPQNTDAGGWGFYGPGQLANNSRFWVDINDQDANCWSRTATTAKSLSVNSSGADGVAIAASPSDYSGATNYTQTEIPAGTSITLTAPAAGSEITAFSSWDGCDSTDAEARTCTVTMSEDKTVTAIFVINSYTVTPSAGTGGSISPNTPQSVNSWATFDFTVTPSTGYVIDTVEGCGGTLNGSVYTTGAIIADCTVTASFKLNDSDRDGVADRNDQCPNTARSTVVDRSGCSISQLVPCQGPKGTTAFWKNKGQYVSAVSKNAESFLAAGLITLAEKDAIVSAAAKSGCGGKEKEGKKR